MVQVTDFGANWRKLAYPTFILCAGIFHNGLEDRSMDARVNTADDPSTSVKNVMNFDPVTLEFCRCVCAERAARWALPRICSLVLCATLHGSGISRERCIAVESVGGKFRHRITDINQITELCF